MNLRSRRQDGHDFTGALPHNYLALFQQPRSTWYTDESRPTPPLAGRKKPPSALEYRDAQPISTPSQRVLLPQQMGQSSARRSSRSSHSPCHGCRGRGFSTPPAVSKHTFEIRAPQPYLEIRAQSDARCPPSGACFQIPVGVLFLQTLDVPIHAAQLFLMRRGGLRLTRLRRRYLGRSGVVHVVR